MNLARYRESLDAGQPGTWSPGRQRFVLALLAVYLVGFHLRLSLYSGSGSIIVPMYPMLVPATVLGLMQGNEFLRRTGQFLLLLTCFIFIQPFLAFAPLSTDPGNLTNMAQLLASVISALIVIHTAATLPATALRRLFFGFWVVLMVLAAAEVLGLGQVMASLRELIYAGSGRGIYDSAVRDQLIYGRVRSSALASEPSFLADSWMAMTALVFLIGRATGARHAWQQLFMMLVVGYALAPSSKLVFYLLAVAIWVAWPRTKTLAQRLAIVAPVALTVLAVSGLSLLQIIDRFNSSATGSFFARVTVGPYVGLSSLREHPLLGFGIGNAEAATPLIRDQWQELGGFARFPWFAPFSGDDLMGSAFWWQWVYLGVLGTMVFLALVAGALKRLGVHTPWRAIACAWIVWYSAFAFIDPACWFLVAVFAIPQLFENKSSELSAASATTSDAGG